MELRYQIIVPSTKSRTQFTKFMNMIALFEEVAFVNVYRVLKIASEYDQV